MNAALNERLMHYADAARKAGHGQKEAVYQAACRELGMSRATVLKKLKTMTVKPPRRQRADAGKTALTREEALIISGAWLESRRNNDKRLYSLKNLVQALRANGMISAGRTDRETGEFFPLSTDAISRALRSYRLHYDQLQAPAPALELKSLHPNHVWELDASICVLYYLKNPDKRRRGDTGLRIMDRDTFYKNKPKNLERIVNDRVWSFELIDHTTNWIYVEYRFGGESAENFLNVMINAMQERGGEDVLHGIPEILFTDPGSALVSASLLNMCRTLGIRCLQHKARNAQATGAVEKARDIIECDFEAGLRFVRVETIEQLNHYARLWRTGYNLTHIIGRHGESRTDAWKTILNTEYLVKAPSPDICRELAIAAPEERTVTNKLRVSFRGQEFSVENVPHACVGDKLLVTRNPWHENEARIVITDEDGFENYVPVYAVEKDEWGYAVDAPVIGEKYGHMPVTEAQLNRIEVEQAVYGTTDADETARARKSGAIPFGGRFNPYKEIEEAGYHKVTSLPSKGREVEIPVRLGIEVKPLTHVQAAMALRTRLKGQTREWNPTWYPYLVEHYPDGIPEEQLDAILQELLALSDSVVVSLAGK
ncbi:transposase family protein [Salmonella enterica]|nr:transposase family protein [Salmonella enterica]